ncbi:MAG: hemerythrin domain-containing protein [Myxococcales bacterium]|nr:hemerythrin domain-containing protein [Myxococcales bacterium]
MTNDPSAPVPDFFAQLLRDHHDLEACVVELGRAADQLDAVPGEAAALATLATALAYFDGPAARHQADEEQLLFPQLRSLPAFTQMIPAFECQHQLNDGTLAELRAALQPGAPARIGTVADLVRRFVEMQRAHILAEERALFPLAARTLAPAIVENLTRAQAARRG